MNKSGSQLLFETQPLVINPELAGLIGLNEAIILQQVKYWIEIHRERGINFYEGRHWVYNRLEDWGKKFPFLSRATIWRAIKNLRENGILMTGYFNHDPGDRTLWYTIDYEKLDSYCEDQRKSIVKSAQGIPVHPCDQNDQMVPCDQNEHMDVIKMSTCLNTETILPETNCLLVTIKKDPRFNKLFSEFCLRDDHRYREQTFYFVLRCAENNKSPVDDILHAFEVCSDKDRCGDLKYFNGILMNKMKDRAKGIIAPGKPPYWAIIEHLRNRLEGYIKQGFIKNYDVDAETGTIIYEWGDKVSPDEDLTDVMNFICQDVNRAMGTELTIRQRT